MSDTGGFVLTHVAPQNGLQAWLEPDPAGAVVATLQAGTQLHLLERRGAWAKVAFSNGWAAWVDGRRIVDAAPAATSPPGSATPRTVPAADARQGQSQAGLAQPAQPQPAQQLQPQAGQSRSGQPQAGQSRSGQPQAGQSRSGQPQAGRSQAGLPSPGPAGPAQPMPGQPEAGSGTPARTQPPGRRPGEPVIQASRPRPQPQPGQPDIAAAAPPHQPGQGRSGRAQGQGQGDQRGPGGQRGGGPSLDKGQAGSKSKQKQRPKQAAPPPVAPTPPEPQPARPAEPAPSPGPVRGRLDALPAIASIQLSPSLIGAAGILLGTILSWIRVAGTKSNAYDVPMAFLWDYEASNDGGIKVGLLLLAVAIFVAVFAILPGKVLARRVLGGVTAAIALLYTIQLQRALSALGDDAPSLASAIGFGVLITIAAGTAIVFDRSEPSG